jgi:hypothetical protein
MGIQVKNTSVGRPTVANSSLSLHRDRILSMLSRWWGEIGWQLCRATTREALRAALEPLSAHADKYDLNRFLLVNVIPATAEQIRTQREVNKRAIEEMYKAQARQRTCSERFERAQMAFGHTPAEQLEPMKARILAYKVELQSQPPRTKPRKEINERSRRSWMRWKAHMHRTKY